MPQIYYSRIPPQASDTRDPPPPAPDPITSVFTQHIVGSQSFLQFLGREDADDIVREGQASVFKREEDDDDGEDEDEEPEPVGEDEEPEPMGENEEPEPMAKRRRME